MKGRNTLKNVFKVDKKLKRTLINNWPQMISTILIFNYCIIGFAYATPQIGVSSHITFIDKFTYWLILSIFWISILLLGMCTLINICKKINTKKENTESKVSKNVMKSCIITLSILSVWFVIMYNMPLEITWHISKLQVLSISTFIICIVNWFVNKIRKASNNTSTKVLFIIGIVLLILEAIITNLNIPLYHYM